MCVCVCVCMYVYTPSFPSLPHYANTYTHTHTHTHTDELSQTSPGSATWLTWRDVFHFIDIICCCAILFPIVWSIRHLRQAAAADGKMEHILLKLTLFRQFYLLVVAYIYFTR